MRNIRSPHLFRWGNHVWNFWDCCWWIQQPRSFPIGTLDDSPSQTIETTCMPHSSKPSIASMMMARRTSPGQPLLRKQPIGSFQPATTPAANKTMESVANGTSSQSSGDWDYPKFKYPLNLPDFRSSSHFFLMLIPSIIMEHSRSSRGAFTVVLLQVHQWFHGETWPCIDFL